MVAVDPGANSWKSGRTVRLTLEEVAMRGLENSEKGRGSRQKTPVWWS